MYGMNDKKKMVNGECMNSAGDDQQRHDPRSSQSNPHVPPNTYLRVQNQPLQQWLWSRAESHSHSWLWL